MSRAACCAGRGKDVMVGSQRARNASRWRQLRTDGLATKLGRLEGVASSGARNGAFLFPKALQHQLLALLPYKPNTYHYPQWRFLPSVSQVGSCSSRTPQPKAGGTRTSGWFLLWPLGFFFGRFSPVCKGSAQRACMALLARPHDEQDRAIRSTVEAQWTTMASDGCCLARHRRVHQPHQPKQQQSRRQQLRQQQPRQPLQLRPSSHGQSSCATMVEW